MIPSPPDPSDELVDQVFQELLPSTAVGGRLTYPQDVCLQFPEICPPCLDLRPEP